MTEPHNIIGHGGQLRKEFPHEMHFRLLRDWLGKGYRRSEHDACVEFVAAGVRCEAGEMSKVRGRAQDQVATLFLERKTALSSRFDHGAINLRLFESYVTSGLLSPDALVFDVGHLDATNSSDDYNTSRDRSALEAAVYHRLYAAAALMVDHGFLARTDVRESLKRMLSTYRDEVSELGAVVVGDAPKAVTPEVALATLAEVSAALNGEEASPEYARLKEALMRHHVRTASPNAPRESLRGPRP